MAQMELQLSTKTAIAALEAFEKKLATTQGALSSLTTGTVGTVAKELVNLKNATPNQNHAKAIGAYAAAISKLGNAKGVSTLAASLQSLQGLGSMQAAATHVGQLAAALTAIKVPRGMAAFVKNVNALATAAGTAAPRVLALARALGGATPPTNMGAAVAGINNVGRAAGNAGGQVKRFGIEYRALGGIGLGLGLQQTLAALKQIGGASIEAADEFTAFTSKMKVAGNDAIGVAENYDWVRKTTQKLAIPLNEGMQAFSKMSVAMYEAKRPAEETRRVFEGFSTGFRAMGLNTQQTGRAFNAVTQMFTKGSVTMEELRQQLGEVFPAFGLLADSMGITTEALVKLMANGKVASTVLTKLADDIKAKFGAAAEFMSTTGTAAVINFKSALFELSAFSGEALYKGLRGGLQSLSDAMNTNAVKTFAAAIGYILGGAMSIAAYAVGFLSQTVGYFLQIVSGGVNLIYNFFNALTGGSGAATFLSVTMQGIVDLFNLVGPPILAAGIALWGLTKIIWLAQVAWKAYATVAGLAWAATARFGLIAVAVVGSVMYLTIAAKALVDSFRNGTTYQEEMSKSLANMKANLTNAGAGIADFANEVSKSVTPMLNMNAASEEQKKSLADLADYQRQAAREAAGLKEAQEGAAQGTDDMGDAAAEAKAKVKALKDEEKAIAAASKEAHREAQDFAESLNDLDKMAGGAYQSANKLAMGVNASGNAMAGAVADANRLASSYDRVASSASRASSAGRAWTTTAGQDADRTYTTDFNFGLKDSAFDFGGNRDGGTALSPSMTQRASLSAFSRAPQFASGIANTSTLTPTLPGGGIPSILHGNEAVVPLASGGSIPVSMSGDAGSAAGLATLKSINSSIGSYLSTFSMWSVDVLSVLKKIHTVLTTMDGRASSYNSGGSSGGSSSGGSSSGAGGSAIAPNFMTGLGLSGSVGSGGGSSGGGISGGGSSLSDARGEYLDIKAQLAALDAENQDIMRWNVNGVAQTREGRKRHVEILNEMASLTTQINRVKTSNPELMKEIAAKKKANPFAEMFGGDGAYTFATGSPNASKDTRGGGFNATLHPDEAVIPLPDGRSVPVTLPPAMQRMLSDRGGMGNNDGPRVTNITMNITTPDANSFAKSQTQIQNELRANIARTQERSGPPSRRIEDPTRRTAQVK